MSNDQAAEAFMAKWSPPLPYRPTTKKQLSFLKNLRHPLMIGETLLQQLEHIEGKIEERGADADQLHHWARGFLMKKLRSDLVDTIVAAGGRENLAMGDDLDDVTARGLLKLCEEDVTGTPRTQRNSLMDIINVLKGRLRDGFVKKAAPQGQYQWYGAGDGADGYRTDRQLKALEDVDSRRTDATSARLRPLGRANKRTGQSAARRPNHGPFPRRLQQ
jgi:hypothetical protein